MFTSPITELEWVIVFSYVYKRKSSDWGQQLFLISPGQVEANNNKYYPDATFQYCSEYNTWWIKHQEKSVDLVFYHGGDHTFPFNNPFLTTVKNSYTALNLNLAWISQISFFMIAIKYSF
jgi:hypothetical protein